MRQYLLDKEVKDYTGEELIEYVEETYKESDNDATRISINLMIYSWVMNNRSESYDSMTNTLEYLKRKGLIKSTYN